MDRRKILAAAVLVLLVLLVVVPFWIAYSSLNPERCQSRATPDSVGLEYSGFTVETGDGVEIRGWHIPGDEDVLFIVMHGYTSCKADERLLRLARELNSRGYPVAMFDFRGHGESEGTTTIGPREVLDLEAVLDYASTLGYEEIVLVGFSMGAAVAIVGGSYDNRVVAIIADSPYYSLDQVIPRWIGSQTPLPAAYGYLIGLYGELLAGVDTSFGPAYVDRVDKPLLVFYGDMDPLLTAQEATEIVAKSPCGKLVRASDAGHVEIAERLGLDKYVDEIEYMLDEVECPE
ncbi:MAG: alpha/beta hydrolase [Desulfurococcales archaeon]|nr:alpha/beta hydrolase [Desulfurococcales archaeon]